MKVSITDKNENKVLQRTELKFKVEDVKVPPSRKEVREKIAALQNVKPEQTIVSSIEHGFGSKKVEGTARIYSSEEQLKKVELPYMVGRNIGVKKGKEKAETPAAEEAKPEEKKEAVPPEKPAEQEEKPAQEEKKEKEPAEKKEEKPVEKKEGE